METKKRITFDHAMAMFDLVTVGTVCALYGVALGSIAIGQFWTGPDFDFGPFTGWDCLRTGWFDELLGWLANPTMLVAATLLLCRRRLGAFLFALGGVGLALLWTRTFCQRFPAKLLENGYEYWMMSMAVLAAGCFCSISLRYLHSRYTAPNIRLIGHNEI
jgi:hypothetical protein